MKIGCKISVHIHIGLASSADIDSCFNYQWLVLVFVELAREVNGQETASRISKKAGSWEKPSKVTSLEEIKRQLPFYKRKKNFS